MTGTSLESCSWKKLSPTLIFMGSEDSSVSKVIPNILDCEDAQLLLVESSNVVNSLSFFMEITRCFFCRLKFEKKSFFNFFDSVIKYFFLVNVSFCFLFASFYLRNILLLITLISLKRYC
ncbi:hypothetical protein CDIK_4113 [Cucumispora dikerogammari]|nr:hypothetical protein CDIK_4113 [Cucumispora dikerogammari]